MRRVFCLFSFILITISLSGCSKMKGSTTKICTIKKESYEEKIKISGMNNKIEKFEITYIYDNSLFGIDDLTTLNDNEKEKIKSNILKTLGYDKVEYEGLVIDVNIQENMEITLKVDINKVDSTLLKNVGLEFSNTNLNFNDAVKSYINSSYICK